jgi:uncharacterized membrane-anchored protein
MRKRAVFFALAVLVQLAILAALPSARYLATVAGTGVYLKIAPYDPYNILSGRFAQITFPDVSQLPIGVPQNNVLQEGQELFLIIEPGDYGVWTTATYSSTYPEFVGDGQVVMKGAYEFGRVIFGIESFYIQEDLADDFAKQLSENTDSARALVNIDSQGNCAIIQVELGPHIYK